MENKRIVPLNRLIFSQWAHGIDIHADTFAIKRAVNTSPGLAALVKTDMAIVLACFKRYGGRVGLINWLAPTE